MLKKAALYAVLALTCVAASSSRSFASTTSGSGSGSTTNVTGTDPEPIDPGGTSTTVEIILTLLQLA